MEKERRKEEEVGSFICIFWGIQIDAILRECYPYYMKCRSPLNLPSISLVAWLIKTLEFVPARVHRCPVCPSQMDDEYIGRENLYISFSP